jgi:flagellar biosynthesis/type III secretory pathway protein FliH
MRKLVTKLLPLSLLLLVVACGNPYEDGFKEGKAQGYKTGYDEGYDTGHAEGDTHGFERAKIYFETAGYNEGFADGKDVGIQQCYASGYTVGKNETYKPNYDRGYNVGYAQGDKDGYEDGFRDGYSDGYDDRYDEVFNQGYNVGYGHGYDDGADDGYDNGYDAGFGDGYDAGSYDSYGLSIGKSKKLQGYANLISLAHNDLIDYEKISMPVQTKKGLLVNGSLLLSETSLTNKDTLKRAAVVEQYVVVEMAKQVKGKFGLSADRSLKIAKAANHFRKYSSTRALTSEDTNAYASEIIGSDFKAIERAYEQTLKGDVMAFQSVLEKAAEKNDTSAANISVILTQYFL